VNMRQFSLSFAGQRGGMFLGIIVGLLVGLGAALAVAIYVTKVPVPFVNRGVGGKTTAENDAQEVQKNKNWDPNAPLYGKNPAKPMASGSVGTTTSPQEAPLVITPPVEAASTPKVAAAPKAVASAPKPAASAPKPASADPLGDLAKAKTANTPATSAPAPTVPAAASTGADPFTYFVQAGAFRTLEDAEAQKAKLGMSGFEAKITEREQSGRTVFRVRVGPMDKRDDVDRIKDKLDGAGYETAIVRVQR
jgi:cell division protein FtsN